MKICKKCNQNKELKEFNKNKAKKNNIDIYCKLCVREKGKKYRKIKIPLISKYPIENKVCRKCKEDLPKNNFSKKINESDGLYYYCRECVKIIIKDKEWYKNQYKNNKKYRDDYNKNKRKKDINYRLRSNLRCRMNNLLSIQHIKRSNSSLKYLGCTIEEYKKYIELKFKGEMDWLNYGILWEIDHIFPLSKFDLIIEENIYKAFNYTNTQPLYKNENRIKKDKIIND